MFRPFDGHFQVEKSKFLYAFKIYTIDYKNANEILDKTLKYLYRNNTHTNKKKLQHE